MRLAPAPKLEAGVGLVIEAPPRSAKTFAVLAFQGANPSVKVEHHRHHPGMITQASARGVPALVIIRDPADACASFAVYDRFRPLEVILSRWVNFYADLNGARYVLASFADVTKDFGSVIARVNRTFSAAFAETTPGAEAIFDEIDVWAEGKWPTSAMIHDRVPRPDPRRGAALAAGRAKVRRLAGYSQARSLYRAMLAGH